MESYQPYDRKSWRLKGKTARRKMHAAGSSLQKEGQKCLHQITDGKEGRFSQVWLIKLATPNSNILWGYWNKRHPDTGKDWAQKEKGATEDERVGWHHRLDGHGFGWTLRVADGQGGLRAVVHGASKSRTQLSDWTELIAVRKNEDFWWKRKIVRPYGKLLQVPWKIKNRITIFSNPISAYISKRTESRISKRYLHTYIQKAALLPIVKRKK